MPTVLIATDADWIFAEVDAALGDDEMTSVRVKEGSAVLAAVHEHHPSLVVLDLQIGNMGGLAACLHLRNEEGAGRVDGGLPILVLLDRAADVFLARRSGADGWIIKPLDAFRLRKASQALLGGGSYEEHADVVTIPPS